MAYLLWESKPIARRAYACDACHWLREGAQRGEFTFAELRAIARAKQQGWRILKGQQYLRQVTKEGREIMVFRAIPEIDKICWDHEFYPQDY